MWCLTSSTNLFAQSSQEIADMRQLMPVEVRDSPTYLKEARKAQTEWDWTFSQFFLFYKAFISSQDVNQCSFHPSCSVYAMRSVRKKGMVIGLLATFDRLSRCNGLSPEWYELHPRHNLLIDQP